MIPFVLLFVLLGSVIALALRYRGMPFRRALRLGIVLATVPVLLLVLQSIGQLTVKDILTILILFVVSYFYIARVSASPRRGQ